MFYITPGQVQILGISGQIGNGKTTLTKLAVREFGFASYALARHFKVDVVAKDGMDPLAVFGASEHKTPESRDRLQQRGTEEGRNVYGESVWLKHAEAHIYDMLEHGHERIIISDVRFENEVRWVQSLGGVVYRVFGRNPVVTSGHSSETALNEWGYTAPDGTPGFDRMFRNTVGRSASILDEVRAAIARDFSTATPGLQRVA